MSIYNNRGNRQASLRGCHRADNTYMMLFSSPIPRFVPFILQPQSSYETGDDNEAELEHKNVSILNTIIFYI